MISLPVAVDSKVGRQLYAAIQDFGVKRGKCVILVTHQNQYVGDSKCVVMTGGRACVRDKSDLTLCAHFKGECEDREEKAQSSQQQSGVDFENRVSDHRSNPTIPTTHNDNEASNLGVKMGTFVSYLRAMPGGLWSGSLVLLLFTLSQGLAAATVALCGKWSTLRDSEQLSAAIIATIATCSLGSVILAAIRGLLFFRFAIQASSNLHQSMTKSVLRARINFFDQPVVSILVDIMFSTIIYLLTYEWCALFQGRILDRFSADVGSNDDVLAGTLSDVLTLSFMVLGAVTIAITILPIALVLVPPMLLVLIRVRRTFMTSSCELKKFEGAARSSMLAILGESLDGIMTIRSNDAGHFFRQRFQNAHDVSV